MSNGANLPGLGRDISFGVIGPDDNQAYQAICISSDWWCVLRIGGSGKNEGI